MLHRYLFLLILCGLLCPTLSAQNVEQYFFRQKDCVQEKLHITTDRPYYAPGDTVWFRGTLVAADNLSYMIRSNYITLELIDPMGDVRVRRKVRREGLCFQHCLPLDSTLLGGRYQLRAYTSWMRNFDADGFYRGSLLVIGPTAETVDTETPTPQAVPDFDVTFLPEGGSRVAGCRQKIAFKALGEDGLPVEVRGTIHLAGEKKVLATFSSQHDGMGWFWLEAANNNANLALEATVTVTSGLDARGMSLTRTFALPEAVGQWALQVAPESSEPATRVRYRVLSSDAVTSINKCQDSLYLLLHSGANLIEMRPIVAGDEGVIDLQNCRVGISQLVLCTANGIGLSRRLLFRQPDEASLPQSVTKVQAPNAPRQSASLNLTLTDASGRPLRGDFAVSLLDASFIEPTMASPDETLTSNLLLSSDLHGTIHSSAYYTDPSVPIAQRAEALDCLLLTHGWSRFATDTMQVRDIVAMPHPLESNEWVSGYVDGFRNRKDRKDLERVAISVVDTMGGSWGTAMLDSTGRFFVGNLDYPNKMPLQVRLLSYSANPHYHFDLPTFPELMLDPALTSQRGTMDISNTDSLYRVWLKSLLSKDTRLLSDVVVTERRPGYGRVTYQHVMDAAEISQEIDLYAYPRALDVVNELMWKEKSEFQYADPFEDDFFNDAKKVNINRQYVPKISSIVGKDWTASRPVDIRKPALIIKNVSNKNLYSDYRGEPLEYLSSADIESIEFLRRDSTYVIVTFKPGTYISSERPNRRAVTYYAFGYTEPEYFYHPRYETRADRDYPQPDLRKTLSWFPSIQTDEEGRISVKFYTSDHPTNHYLLQVEGVTFDGRAVSIRNDLQQLTD